MMNKNYFIVLELLLKNVKMMYAEDSKLGYFHDLVSSVLLKISHQWDQFSLIRFDMKDQPQ